MFDFGERVIMITGAAGNLGYAVARAFQAANGRLVLVDRGTDRLPRLFPELAHAPRHHLATSVDLAAEQAVDALVADTLSRLGRLDVLVNTVGGYRPGKAVHETPLDEWESMLNLNVRTAFLISRAVVPGMLKQGHGRIIHVASRGALQGSAKSAAYSASKSALVRLTEALSAEVKRAGINTNCILPSTIDTPENRQEMPNADHSRWVRPEAIADVVLFLASDLARAIHGAAIPVYGTG